MDTITTNDYRPVERFTVAPNHAELVGTPVIVDGWNATISDTTVTYDGEIFVSLSVKAMNALYLEYKWINLKVVLGTA
jgi:hypothetical protein